MKRLYVTILCNAYCQSFIDVPDDMTLEDAFAVAEQNLDTLPMGTLSKVDESAFLDDENYYFD